MRDSTPSQLAFMETELERLIGIGAWRKGEDPLGSLRCF
jgi:hypothetical protein